MSTWIDVMFQSPMPRKFVITYYPQLGNAVTVDMMHSDGTFEVGRRTAERDGYDVSKDCYTPTHWTPIKLPKPPKEGGCEHE